MPLGALPQNQLDALPLQTMDQATAPSSVLVVGKKEAEVRSVSVRRSGQGAGSMTTLQGFDLHDLLDILSEEIETRRCSGIR